MAAERAYRLGCNTFQIFSSSPRQWKPYELSEPQCEEMSRLRSKYGIKPLVDSHQLSGQPGQRDAGVSSQINGCFSRRDANGRWRYVRSIWCCIPDHFADVAAKKGLRTGCRDRCEATQGLDLEKSNLKYPH